MSGSGNIGSNSVRRLAVLGATGVLLVAVVLVLSSCSATSKGEFSQGTSAMPGGAPGMRGMPGPGGMGGPGMPVAEQASSAVPGEGSAGMPSEGGDTSFPPVGSAESSLLIIKTADLTIKVENMEMAGDQVVQIARSVGGFVTNSTFSRAEDEEATPYATMTIRVPVGAFDMVISRVGKIGEVKARNLNGEDVTGQVFDLESRLRNKRAEEAQYVDIMQRAKKIPDIVTVSNQLFRVHGEIEQIEGRVKYLRSASNMSTISITLTEPKTSTEKGIAGVWQRAVDSLKNASVALLAALIWIGVFAPFWIAALIVLYVLVRLARKRMA